MRDCKFDLCADKATLDYEELVRTSIIAVKYSLVELHKRLNKWYDHPFKCTSLDASWMEEAAEDLATATRAYSYLLEGRSREEVIIDRRLDAKVSKMP